MTRRRRPGRPGARPEERAARRKEEPRRRERAAAAPPHYGGDVERRLAEDVLYLHSLWRSGPPVPAPHPGGGSVATHVRADRRKRRRLKRLAEPEDPGYAWPLPSSPPDSPSARSWPDASSSSPTHHPPPSQPSPAWLAQSAGLRAAEEFFSGHASEGDSDEEEEDGSESEDAGEEEAAARFFVGLFERDAELRGFYEQSYEEGEFLCMGCAGRRARKGRARRFRDCISLVQHARAATRCGRRRAHRALASTVCRVLGWDIERLPSIVIDPRGTLGQALLAREREGASAAAHEAKENVDTEENGGSPSDGDAAKEAVDIRLSDGPLGDAVAAKEGVDTGKTGSSSNGSDGAVHEQENVIESSEKEDTNDTDPLSSKDTPMELSKSVQEEEGAVDNKQEHAKSAHDMGGSCNVSLGNNVPKEQPARENKEEHIGNVVGTGDNDLGNLGTNLTDSSKS